MELGNTIAEYRKASNMSQEELGRKIGVSRSAVAKWENGNGIPDIENLRALAKEFQVPMEKLLDGEAPSLAGEKQGFYSRYWMKRCVIDLTDWNDGASDAYVVGEDETFLFYVVLKKKERKAGAIAKKYISKISLEGKKEKAGIDLSSYAGMGREYFLYENVDIYLDSRHFWSGLVGEPTEILGGSIMQIRNDHILIEPGEKEIELNQVVKIEKDEQEY